MLCWNPKVKADSTNMKHKGRDVFLCLEHSFIFHLPVEKVKPPVRPMFGDFRFVLTIFQSCEMFSKPAGSLEYYTVSVLHLSHQLPTHTRSFLQTHHDAQSWCFIVLHFFISLSCAGDWFLREQASGTWAVLPFMCCDRNVNQPYGQCCSLLSGVLGFFCRKSSMVGPFLPRGSYGGMNLQQHGDTLRIKSHWYWGQNQLLYKWWNAPF